MDASATCKDRSTTVGLVFVTVSTTLVGPLPGFRQLAFSTAQRSPHISADLLISACADSADPAHARCRTARDTALEAGQVLVTTDFVVDETLTLVRLRLGVDAAEAWWQQIDRSLRLRWERIDSDRFEAARAARDNELAMACYPLDMAQPDLRRQPATYDDLLKVPDHLVAEIVGGELYASPRPAPRHADASSGLGGALRGPFDRGRGGPGGWRILDEPELHLGADVLVPDLAGWRRERMPALPEEAYFSVAPDWICEVLSPSTASLDRVKKMTVYARERVAHAWLVDPIGQTLEVLRLDNSRWTILSTWAKADVVRAEPFDALEVDLTLLWETT